MGRPTEGRVAETLQRNLISYVAGNRFAAFAGGSSSALRRRKPTMNVVSRLVLQLALGVAFGAGQIIFGAAASHVSMVWG